MMKFIYLLALHLILFLVLLPSTDMGATHAAESRPLFDADLESISPTGMQSDIEQLSGPNFKGRQTGMPGDHLSAQFVIDRLQQLGVQPAQPTTSLGSRSWIQTQDLRVSQIEPQPHFRIHSTAGYNPQLGLDYLPILDSLSVNVTAPVVFVGYGISDPARNFDEYENIDVRNRIVLFLRGKPTSYPKRISHAEKERTARNKGAVAFLTVTGPVLSGYAKRRGMTTTPLAYYGQTESSDDRPLPGAWISPKIAESILTGNPSDTPKELASIQEQLNARKEPQSRKTSTVIHLKWSSQVMHGQLVNVLGKIPGKGKLANEVVVLGAHRDHFGEQAGLLFPGADDNASGTAVLLEVARALMQSKTTERRTIVLASFSGEEAGMLGSKLYVAQPPLPLTQTVAMVNVDHVAVGNGMLTIGVTHQPKAIAEEAGVISKLKDKLKVYGFFPGGDHVPFHQAGIPTVTVVTAGPHPHFHQPGDTSDSIKPDILTRAAQYVLAVISHLATKP